MQPVGLKEHRRAWRPHMGGAQDLNPFVRSTSPTSGDAELTLGDSEHDTPETEIHDDMSEPIKAP
jgi:hypothetical protein